MRRAAYTAHGVESRPVFPPPSVPHWAKSFFPRDQRHVASKLSKNSTPSRGGAPRRRTGAHLSRPLGRNIKNGLSRQRHTFHCRVDYRSLHFYVCTDTRLSIYETSVSVNYHTCFFIFLVPCKMIVIKNSTGGLNVEM